MSDPNGGTAVGPAALDDVTTSRPVGHDQHPAEAGEHGHGDSLGPIDWAAWGSGLLGLVVGLGTAVAFAIATNRVG